MNSHRYAFSRRDFLRVCGSGLLGAAWLERAAAIQQLPPAAPTNLRIATKAMLAPSDFAYLGQFLMPNDPMDQNNQQTRFGYSFGNITGRYVGDQLRIAITGSAGGAWTQPVYEIGYPGYDLDFNRAPRAPLIWNWGDVYTGKRIIYRTNSGPETRGLTWRTGPDGRMYLWWAYGDVYNASSTSWDPSIGASYLDPASGQATAYGPWRTSQHSQRTRGFMMPIPDSWAAMYTGGHTFGVGAPITSGNQMSPWGPSLFAMQDIDPTATPPDPVQTASGYSGAEPKTLKCQTLILNDHDSPAPRDDNYISCGWNTNYDCSLGSTMTRGTRYFQQLDTVSAGVWIETPTKQGVIFMGQLVGPAPGVSDLPHLWYGPQTCCHGRTANKAWEATGPGTDSLMPYWWIYNPDDFAQVAQGRMKPSSLVAASTINQYDVYGQSVFWYFHGGAWFDAKTNLLFVGTRYEDKQSNPYEPRPIIHVFQVKA